LDGSFNEELEGSHVEFSYATIEDGNCESEFYETEGTELLADYKKKGRIRSLIGEYTQYLYT